MNLGYVILGAIAAIAGLAMLVVAIRTRRPDDPKSSAMLIVGMMVLAFGVTLAGFAIAFATTAPLDLNSSSSAGEGVGR